MSRAGGVLKQHIPPIQLEQQTYKQPIGHIDGEGYGGDCALMSVQNESMNGSDTCKVKSE